MPAIEVTAVFEVRFTMEMSDNAIANLENGMGIDQIVDETEAYRRAATEGTCDMDWDYVKLKPKTAIHGKKTKAQKPKAARRTKRK